jgi:hypothetical protein
MMEPCGALPRKCFFIYFFIYLFVSDVAGGTLTGLPAEMFIHLFPLVRASGSSYSAVYRPAQKRLNASLRSGPSGIRRTVLTIP